MANLTGKETSALEITEEEALKILEATTSENLREAEALSLGITEEEASKILEATTSNDEQIRPYPEEWDDIFGDDEPIDVTDKESPSISSEDRDPLQTIGDILDARNIIDSDELEQAYVDIPDNGESVIDSDETLESFQEVPEEVKTEEVTKKAVSQGFRRPLEEDILPENIRDSVEVEDGLFDYTMDKLDEALEGVENLHQENIDFTEIPDFPSGSPLSQETQERILNDRRAIVRALKNERLELTKELASFEKVMNAHYSDLNSIANEMRKEMRMNGRVSNEKHQELGRILDTLNKEQEYVDRIKTSIKDIAKQIDENSDSIVKKLWQDTKFTASRLWTSVCILATRAVSGVANVLRSLTNFVADLGKSFSRGIKNGVHITLAGLSSGLSKMTELSVSTGKAIAETAVNLGQSVKLGADVAMFTHRSGKNNLEDFVVSSNLHDLAKGREKIDKRMDKNPNMYRKMLTYGDIEVYNLVQKLCKNAISVMERNIEKNEQVLDRLRQKNGDHVTKIQSMMEDQLQRQKTRLETIKDKFNQMPKYDININVERADKGPDVQNEKDKPDINFM